MSTLYQRFDTEAAYREAIDTVLREARHNISILDYDLSRMQLESLERSRLLTEFIEAPGERERQVLIAVQCATLIETRMPRLVEILKRHPHTVEIRSIPDEFSHLSDCQVLVDAKHGVRRFHASHARGVLILNDTEEIHPWRMRFNELWSLCKRTMSSPDLRI
jgi:hypothetical protein